eukprot:jgi/Undpi1/3258/HiC_scaffold_15.g06632.m1
MTPIVQDFTARATMAVEALLASCRRLCDTPGRDACPGVAYILSCENFDVFMWLMRPADSPWSPSTAREQSNQERRVGQLHAGQGPDSFPGMPCASAAAMADEEDNTMDLGGTIGTEMAVASPTSLEQDLARMLDPINDINTFLDPSEAVYPDIFSAATEACRAWRSATGTTGVHCGGKLDDETSDEAIKTTKSSAGQGARPSPLPYNVCGARATAV